MKNKITFYKDSYGNTARIEPVITHPFKGGFIETGYRLVVSADYDNDFVYFVSMYETFEAAYQKLKQFSCGSFREV